MPASATLKFFDLSGINETPPAVALYLIIPIIDNLVAF